MLGFLRSRLAPRSASSSDPSRSLEVIRNKRPPTRRFLRKSDLEDKQIITRTTGRRFGTVGEAWVEPRRLCVQSFDITNTTQLVRTEIRGSVALQAVREVGDVVLIHSDQDFTADAFSGRLNLMTVPGLKLVLDNGTVVGRCVDFVFEPETGRIVKLVFHTVNFAFAGRMWFDQYAVNVRDISRIVLSQRVIYLKNEASWNKVSVGEYQFLANLIPSFGSETNTEVIDRKVDEGKGDYASTLQSQYEALLEQSKRQQEDYYARYGRRPSSPEPKRKSVSRLPPSRPPPPPTPPPQRSNVRIDDWLTKEERREEMYMQE